MRIERVAQLIASMALLVACQTVTDPASSAPKEVQEPPGGDATARSSIPQLKGCFSVSYQFVSDGQHDFFTSGVIELIDLVDEDGTYELRHFMVNGEKTFHHFTEEWAPLGDGRWRQRVTDGQTGALRYETVGTWRFNQWEGAAVGAAKPIRDATQDYAVLERLSTVQIAQPRWIHSEKNTKRLADGTPIATEVGWVRYERIDDARCAKSLSQ